MKAELVAEELPNHPPVTNLYRGEDGRYIAVVSVNPESMARIFTGMTKVPLSRSHIKSNVAAFLADEKGTLIDYDGNPANGMTPIIATNSRAACTWIDPTMKTHEDALDRLGYTLE